MTDSQFPRIYYVEAKIHGYQFSLHTPDQGKIGPWLCDLVDAMRLPDRPGLPAEIIVKIT